ncbi:hypothetical protein DFJ73DRAFT_902832 [Zopfochytrium polystomum]|nr:hypothetical protein DFJ73DRAFT_902832 [Zopfochytrium polystomum]
MSTPSPPLVPLLPHDVLELILEVLDNDGDHGGGGGSSGSGNRKFRSSSPSSNDDGDDEDDCDDDDDRGESRPRSHPRLHLHGTTATGRPRTSTPFLLQAALVSRAWYAAAVPLLWRTIRPARNSSVRLLALNPLQQGRPLSSRLSFSSCFELIREIDLSCLSIVDAEITFHLQRILMGTRYLERLNLTNCLWVDDTTLLPLFGCTRLKSLILRGCAGLPASGTSLPTALATLSNLRHLDLSGCTGLLAVSATAAPDVAERSPIAQALTTSVAPLRRFDLLSAFHDPGVSRAVYALWSGLARTTLRELAVESVTLDDSAFAPLLNPQLNPSSASTAPLPLSTSDRPADTPLSPPPPSGLSGGPPLAALALLMPNISDASLHALAPHCTRLASLRLLAAPRVSPAGLAAVVAVAARTLRTIDLARCAWVDDGVLTGLADAVTAAAERTSSEEDSQRPRARPRLEDVVVDGCFRVSYDGVAALLRAAPRVRSFSCVDCLRVDADALVREFGSRGNQAPRKGDAAVTAASSATTARPHKGRAAAKEAVTLTGTR